METSWLPRSTRNISDNAATGPDPALSGNDDVTHKVRVKWR